MGRVPILWIKMVMANATTGRMQPIVRGMGTVVEKDTGTRTIKAKETEPAVVKKTVIAVDKVTSIATVVRIRRRPLQQINHQETRKINPRLIVEAGKPMTTGYIPASIHYTRNRNDRS